MSSQTNRNRLWPILLSVGAGVAAGLVLGARGLRILKPAGGS